VIKYAIINKGYNKYMQLIMKDVIKYAMSNKRLNKAVRKKDAISNKTCNKDETQVSSSLL
jgi:hypothetical protein